jgi:TPR repeat protein
MSDPNATIKENKGDPLMANMYEDEMFDEYYSTTCPECQENAVDAYEEKCTHCLLEEMSATYNEDIALEMSLGLDY